MIKRGVTQKHSFIKMVLLYLIGVAIGDILFLEGGELLVCQFALVDRQDANHLSPPLPSFWIATKTFLKNAMVTQGLVSFIHSLLVIVLWYIHQQGLFLNQQRQSTFNSFGRCFYPKRRIFGKQFDVQCLAWGQEGLRSNHQPSMWRSSV